MTAPISAFWLAGGWGGAASATGSLSLGGSASASASPAASGSLSLGGTGAAAATAVATGSLTLASAGAAIAFRAGAHGGANSTAPAVTVPASCAVGDVVLVQLALNNTDVITAVPSGLTLIDNNTTASSGFPNRLYTGVVDGTTISAGTVLTFALSAIRNWTLNLYAASGVDTAAPILGYTAVGSITTTVVMPSLSTAARGWLVEIGSGKSNGTAITSFTPPAGWTIRQTGPSPGTFGGGSFIADLDSGIATTGTYGGETYTPNATPNVVLRYLVALAPAAVLATAPASVSGSLTLGATATALPARILANSAEGASDGVTITVGNSGGASGDPFDAVVHSGTGTGKGSSAQAHRGSLSYLLDTPLSTDIAYLQYTSTGDDSGVQRYAFMLNSLPSATTGLCSMRSSGALAAAWAISAANKLQITDATSVGVKTFSATLQVGVWYQLELECRPGTTTSNGYISGRFYTGNSITPTETQYASSVSNAGTNQLTYYRFGKLSGAGFFTGYVDSIAVNTNTITPVGPLPLAPNVATGSISLGGSAAAAGIAPASAPGSVTLGGIASATAPVSVSGILDLAGSAGASGVAPASGSITLGATAIAAGIAPATTSGSLDLAVTAAGTAPASVTGPLVLAGTSAAIASAAVAGFVALTASSAGSAAAAASGSFVLAGAASATGPVAASATGALVLSAAVGTATAGTASGSLSLSAASGAARAPCVAAGALVLTGAATGTATGGAFGTLALSGSSVAKAVAQVSGLLTLSGALSATTGISVAGILVLFGSPAAAQAPVSALGSLVLTASAGLSGDTASSGWIVVSGLVLAVVPIGVSGTLTLSVSVTARQAHPAVGLVRTVEFDLGTGILVNEARTPHLSIGITEYDLWDHTSIFERLNL